MKLLDLFAGIGGISLGAHWAGIETVGFCEIDPFCQKILKKHWPNVPIWPDVKELTGDEIREACGAVDIIAGGFPCQPYSVAGKRKGEEDDRALWPEMLRIISEVRPRWVVGENVAGFINMGLDNSLDDLDVEGYSSQTFLLPARGIGAFHQRYRVFIVAHLNGERMEGGAKKAVLGQSLLPCRQISQPFQDAERRFHSYQSRLCRSLHGLPFGVDRVRALGNAVVPQQIYPIFKAIMDIENGGAQTIMT